MCMFVNIPLILSNAFSPLYLVRIRFEYSSSPCNPISMANSASALYMSYILFSFCTGGLIAVVPVQYLMPKKYPVFALYLKFARIYQQTHTHQELYYE